MLYRRLTITGIALLLAFATTGCPPDNPSVDDDTGGAGDTTADTDPKPDGGPHDTTADSSSDTAGDDTSSSDTTPDTGGDTSSNDTGSADTDATGGCTPSMHCGSNQYCNYPNNSCGTDGQSGTCDAQPTGCPRVVNPVCGCDGATYNNECEAHRAGVDIEHTGSCTPTDCSSAADCASSEFCDFPNNQCGNGSKGTCKPRPSGCREVYAPVCGCDGNTYGNECKAHAAGVDVKHTGECTSGCTSQSDCSSSQYCDFPDKKCGSGSAGSCKQRPQGCPAVYQPVCGCDGNTHGNECEAHRQGTDVAYTGPC